MTDSGGFSNMSPYNQAFTEEFIDVMSATRRSTVLHLNHALDRAKLFMEQGLIIKGMNFPALQGLIVLDIRS